MKSAVLLFVACITSMCVQRSSANSDCRDDEFECNDGSGCVAKKSYCDRIEDCKDGSDEFPYDAYIHDHEQLCKFWEYEYGACRLPINQTQKHDVLCKDESICPYYKFKCADGSACLDGDKFCDGVVNCNDSSDEILFNETIHTDEDGVSCRHLEWLKNICFLPKKYIYLTNTTCRKDDKCNDDLFACLDGSACTRPIDFCDGTPGCRDKSDETFYNSSIHSEEDGIPCRNKYDLLDICFLPKERLHLESSLCRKDDKCDSDEYKCLDGSKCIGRTEFCNGIKYCRDGSDEIVYNATTHNIEDGIGCLPHASKSDVYCVLPAKFVCDGRIDCPNKADECKCKESKLFCDGKVDCPLEVDECFCSDNFTRSQTVKSNDNCFRCLDDSRVIPSNQICDGLIHCDDLSDECLCRGEQASDMTELCSKIYGEHSWDLSCNDVSFPKHECLKKEDVCDGRNNFLTDIDEMFCPELPTTPKCTDNNETTSGIPVCDWSCTSKGKKDAVKCDGRISCRKFDDECDCENPAEFCNFVGLSWFGQKFFCDSVSFFGNTLNSDKVCDGMKDCDNAIDELYCPHKFYCKNKSPLHIPDKKKCDLITDCDDLSDELECENSTRNCENNDSNTCVFTHFYCNDNGTKKYIDRAKQVCDGNEDCASGVDECQDCTVGIFSDDNSMISSKPLIPILWIISLCSVAGNLLVIFVSIKHLRNMKNLSKVIISQNILVFNLACADLLVGVYTTAISIQNIRLSRVRYCLEDQSWRSGLPCSIIGILLLTGSEQSVFSLCIITGFRLQAVISPLKPIRIRRVIFCMAVSWLLSLFLAVIPVLSSTQDYFTETIWYSQNSFVTIIRREDIDTFVGRLATMLNIATGSKSDWSVLENLISKLNPTYTPDRRFGFYSTHGVCLPRFFPDPHNDAAWGYSLLLIFINFFAFIYIFIGYTVIYVKATNKEISSTTTVKTAVALQKKVTRIVITDFLCWMPICIMALLQLSGIHIPTEVYVPVGTILIPINSALNPFLYTEIPELVNKKIRKLQSSFRSYSSQSGSTTKAVELPLAVKSKYFPGNDYEKHLNEEAL